MRLHFKKELERKEYRHLQLLGLDIDKLVSGPFSLKCRTDYRLDTAFHQETETNFYILISSEVKMGQISIEFLQR